MTDSRNCRFCGTPLQQTFADLGVSPLSNSYLREEDLDCPEVFYPLKARVCDRCFLVQIPAAQTPDRIFQEYAYFSSYSDSWLAHCKKYADSMVKRFQFDISSQIVEIASNDGYMLQYFQAHGIPVLGIEPAANVALVAKSRGIPTVVEFFGVCTAQSLASQGKTADLLLGNNVLAHVPDLNDFVAGMKILLKPAGILTMEFPHLLRLIAERQFDTIYHEHFSYFSLLTAQKVFASHGLTIFDVEQLPTHGGSLRIYGRHEENGAIPVCAAVEAMIKCERAAGLGGLATFARFQDEVQEAKRGILDFLISAKRLGKRVAAYGAPAKGNTLLNYCGVRTDLIEFTVDRSPHKQGLFLPGTRIPILAPDSILLARPDYLLILPWNLRVEIAGQMRHIREWGGQFVTPIPTVEVF